MSDADKAFWCFASILSIVAVISAFGLGRSLYLLSKIRPVPTPPRPPASRYCTSQEMDQWISECEEWEKAMHKHKEDSPFTPKSKKGIPFEISAELAALKVTQLERIEIDKKIKSLHSTRFLLH